MPHPVHLPRVTHAHAGTRQKKSQGTLCGLSGTISRTGDRLWQQAARCRRFAGAINDQRTMDILYSMADEYEEKARKIEEAN